MKKETEAEIRRRLEEDPAALLPAAFSAERLWARMEPALPPKPKLLRADDAIAGLLGLLLIVALAWPRTAARRLEAPSPYLEKAANTVIDPPPAADGRDASTKEISPVRRPVSRTEPGIQKRRAVSPAPIEQERAPGSPMTLPTESVPVHANPGPSILPPTTLPAPVEVIPQKAVVHLLDLKNADLRRATGPVPPPPSPGFFSKRLSRDRVPDPSIAPAGSPSPLSTLN